MKILVTHMSPDLDAIGSVWVIKRFLPGWQDAAVEFVPAGNRLEKVKNNPDFEAKEILTIGSDEIVHVDTGLGPLDHHQTSDMNTSGVKRSWEYVQKQTTEKGIEMKPEHILAITRIVEVIVDIDHFQEVHFPEAAADYHEFSLFGIMEGLQYQKPGEDDYFVEFGRTCLDYLLSYFENKIWAEKEMEKGFEVELNSGKAFAMESINESVVKLAQKKGYKLVIRKDPKKGYVSIKSVSINKKNPEDKGMDLTLAYEQLSKMDPDATWFLHVSKKMLLNGSVKNPLMKPTTLSLDQIVNVIKKLYS